MKKKCDVYSLILKYLNRVGIAFLNGIKVMQEKTCLQFRERTDEDNYILVFAGNGCYSRHGMKPGGQKLSLADVKLIVTDQTV